MSSAPQSVEVELPQHDEQQHNLPHRRRRGNWSSLRIRKRNPSSLESAASSCGGAPTDAPIIRVCRESKTRALQAASVQRADTDRGAEAETEEVRAQSRLESIVQPAVQANHDMAGEALMDEQMRVMPNRVNLSMVVVYHVSLAWDGKVSSIDAALWINIGFIVLVVDLIILLALSTTNNWVVCMKQIDCPTAMACAHVFGYDASGHRFPKPPQCLDCYYLDPQEGGPETWTHTVVGELVWGTNASALCQEALDDPRNRRLFTGYGTSDIPGEGRPPQGGERLHHYQNHSNYEPSPTNMLRTFANCLYGRQAGELMSSLDTMILIGAFLLLAMQGAEDAAEQLNARRMRRLCCPWPLVGGHGDDATFWNFRTAGRVVSSCLLKALDVGYSRAVPALVPTAMLMLLVVRGTTSSDILLNGLSVGFVLELDNAVPNVFLSEYMHEKIKTHYAEAVKEEHQRRRDEYQHQHGSDPVELPDMTAQNRRGKLVCFVTMMLAFTLGFYRMTGPESGIPCEMMLYFSYYRVGLFYGIWVAFCINETIAIVSRVSACLRQRQVHLLLTDWWAAVPFGVGGGSSQPRAARGRARWPQVEAEVQVTKCSWNLLTAAGLTLMKTAVRLIETVLCCLLLNIVMFTVVVLVQWDALFDLAMKEYFEGFVTDIFGTCAASGYKEAWGFDCLAW